MFVQSRRNIFLLESRQNILTYPSCNVSVYPVLIVLVLPPNEPAQDGHEGGEVEEGGPGREPELHHQPVDLELAERLGQTEVVEGEEDGPDEANDDHGEEPVLAVVVCWGTADDAEKCQDLKVYCVRSFCIPALVEKYLLKAIRQFPAFTLR